MRVTPWALLTLIQAQDCIDVPDSCRSFFDSGPGNTNQYSHLGEDATKDFIYQHTDSIVGYTSFKGAPAAGVCFPAVCDGTNDSHCLSIQIQTPASYNAVGQVTSWSLDQSLTALFKPTRVEDFNSGTQLVKKKIHFTLKQPIDENSSQSGASIKPVEPGPIKMTAVYKCRDQPEQVDTIYASQTTYYPGQDFTIYPSNLDPPSFDDVSEFKVTECPNIQGKLTHIASCSNPDVSEYCSMSSTSPKSLDGKITIREFRNVFLSNPDACKPNNCTEPENISLLNDDGKYSLQTGPCDDATDIFCLKATATQNEPADYEIRPFYNYQLLAENLGPWRNGTRPKYATNARFMVEVIDSPDQAPRFNVPPAMVYFKEGKYRTNAAENFITEDAEHTKKLLISASDPDLDLDWDVTVVLNELRTTSGVSVIEKFQVDTSVTEADKPAGDESAVYVKLSSGENFFAECDPEADPENCKSNSPRISNLVLNVLAKERIPADFHADCSDTNKPCKGMPACARGEEFYMQEQSFDITVFIQDINNNPPRFFNSQSKKYEAGPGELKCSYCAEFGILEEGNAENIDLTVFTGGNDPHGIFIADIDADEDNRRFKLSIESVRCEKSATSTNFPCTDAFSVDTTTTFQQQLDPVQVTVTKTINFTEMDRVELVLKACDEGTMADDAASCSTFTVNLEITEKNKAPSFSNYDGGMYEYDQSGAYLVKQLTDEEPGSNELEMTFQNQNSEQFRSVYFCDIKNSDNQEGIFEVQKGDKNGTKWNDFDPDFLKEEGSLGLKIRLREGEQLNRQEAKSYIYTVRACSLEGDADRATVADCCELAGSETRASSRLNITIFDSNINAPLFQIYNGEEDSPPYTLPAGSWNVKDSNSPKIFDLSQIQDDDDDYLNTRTCFRIKSSNANLLNAADFFDINAISITKKTFKSQITQKTGVDFFDEDGFSKIKNEQEMLDGQFHYNFEFTVQACNIDCSSSSCEIPDKTIPIMCPADLDESTAICSDTPKTDDNSLISESTGNTMIRFAIQDSNEHTPEITVEKDSDGNQKILRILEKIGNNFAEPLEIRALDGDRCYFNFGRIIFSTTQDAPFTVEGGDEFNPENNKDRCEGSSLTIGNKGASPTITPKIDDDRNQLSWDSILKNGQNHLDQEVFYNLTVRALDGGNRQNETIVQVLVEDINDHGPTFEELAEKDKKITIKEGTGSGAQSFCGAVDKDSRAWSAHVNRYTVQKVKGYYNNVQKCGPGLEDEVSCDHIFDVTELAEKEATGCSDWVAGRIEMVITADYIPGTAEKGLNREEYDRFSLEIDVEDENCESPNQNEDDCFEHLCHDQCDGVLDENQRLELQVNVEDINDNGPQIAPFKTAHYVLAGTTESGKDITPQIEVSDIDLGDNQKSSITKISETYICGSSAPNCKENKDFFSVTSDPEDPFMKFNLKTLKQIPDINSNNFFAVATIKVEVANNEPLYENYDCAYVEKYPEFFKSECRVDESGHSIIFNTKDIIVTVLDEDHVGLVTSTLEEEWNQEERRDNFKTEMNTLFSDVLPLKNQCDCYFDYSTELYKVETRNRPDPNQNDTIEYFTEIDFYVVKTVNTGHACKIPISNCTLPAARAGEESRDLLESTDIAYVLNDATAHEKLKEDQFQIRVSCNMQRIEECEEVYEEEAWTEKEWLILVIAIGGGLSALCAGIIVCMCCMRKRYARKLQSERAMKYDMDDMSSKDAYNESTAYKASGDQHKNQLVGQEGMINIALAYDDDDEQSSIESSHGRASFNSDFDIEEHLNEPQEIYVDSDAEDAKGPNLNALIAGQSSAVSANPLAGKDLDNMSF